MGLLLDLWEITKEFGEEMKKSKQEFAELMTDGFNEMVINDKTSWQNSCEIETEANRLIKEAKRAYESGHARLEANMGRPMDS